MKPIPFELIEPGLAAFMQGVFERGLRFAEFVPGVIQISYQRKISRPAGKYKHAIRQIRHLFGKPITLQ